MKNREKICKSKQNCKQTDIATHLNNNFVLICSECCMLHVAHTHVCVYACESCRRYAGASFLLAKARVVGKSSGCWRINALRNH